jgi:hypothetical protein
MLNRRETAGVKNPMTGTRTGMRKSLGTGMYPSKPAKRYTYIYIEVQVCFQFEE